MKPTVLVVTTCRWFPTVRLAIALAKAGFAVEALCPPQHPMEKTTAVRSIHPYHGLASLWSFMNAIARAKPDLIVPGDDLAARHLHRIYERENARGQAGKRTCELLEYSLGAPENFGVVYARSTLLQLAREEGIRAPETRVVEDLDDLRRWVASTGLPTVLKVNGTSGGTGVRIARTMEEAEDAFHALEAPPLLVRAAKRAFLDRDKTLVWSALSRRRSIVNAQAFAPGSEATTAVACWKGTVLAGLHFEVVRKRDAAGPATVMRLIDDADMSTAAEKLVRRLKLSGIHGFDYMREAETGKAHLIEMNPRATQVGHLTLGPGRDLPAALYAAVSGEPLRASEKLTAKDTIALFPQEWMRDPASPFLQSAYHDVPWEEPELIGACVREREKRAAWYSLKKWISNPATAQSPSAYSPETLPLEALAAKQSKSRYD